MKLVFSACLSAGVLLAASFGLTGCDSSQSVVIENPAEPVEIVDRGYGDDSALIFADAFLLKNERQVKATGAESLAAINVDYKANALVVVALGQKPTGGFGAEIDSVQVEGGTLVVNVYTSTPPEGSVVTQALTYPYVYAVIPDVTAFEVVVNELN